MANDTLTAIGLMSGTSLDGIDAAIVKTNGDNIESFGQTLALDYDEEFKHQICQVIEGKGDVEELAIEITKKHAQAVELLLQKAKLTAQDIDIIGFHGQTIKHDPDNGVTVQIGDGKLLASLTGIDVVNDLRTNDVKNGGQGAPLVPLYHRALVSNVKLPVAIVNIGGVSNVTYISETDIIAFDTGPGNALVDDWIRKHNAGQFDENGQHAQAGEIDENALAVLVDNPYFEQQPPKSLDRNAFDTSIINDLSLEDGCATLSAFTIGGIIMADHHFPQDVTCWYVTGGGRHNDFMFEGLNKMAMVPVKKIEDLGFDGDMVEAAAFAFLAVRSLYGLPLTLPSTTGVKEPLTGGVLCAA